MVENKIVGVNTSETNTNELRLKMNSIKEILKATFFVSLTTIVTPKNKKILLLFLFPFLLVTIIFNISIIFFAFLFWKEPNSFYFPFLTGGVIQHLFDRFIFFVGIFLIFDEIINET